MRKRNELQAALEFGDPEGEEAAVVETKPSLRWLVAVHHADYEGEKGALTPKGREKIARLAGLICPYNDQAASTAVVSSTVARALESAQIIKLELGQSDQTLMNSELVTRKELAEQSRNPKNMPEVYQQVCQEGVELLIVVAHFGQVRWLPVYFLRQYFGQDIVFFEDDEDYDLGKGEAWLIDIQNQTVEKLSPS